MNTGLSGAHFLSVLFSNKNSNTENILLHLAIHMRWQERQEHD